MLGQPRGVHDMGNSSILIFILKSSNSWNFIPKLNKSVIKYTKNIHIAKSSFKMKQLLT